VGCVGEGAVTTIFQLIRVIFRCWAVMLQLHGQFHMFCTQQLCSASVPFRLKTVLIPVHGSSSGCALSVCFARAAS
jgi:hypothetical protein